MKRKFIPLNKLEVFDTLHYPKGDSFEVNERGQEHIELDTKEHKEGIEYIKNIIKNGQKVLPPLVLENSLGEFIRLDGFKRCMAMKELGFKNIEAFVCTQWEYDHAEYVPFRDGKMRCWKGGQYDDENQRKFPLLEESETFNYNDIKFLFKSPDSSGLRIELCEGVHIHWGEVGKNRLIVGRKDFVALAKAISKI